MDENQKFKKAQFSLALCSVLLLLSSCGMVKKFTETSATSSTNEAASADPSDSSPQGSTPEPTVVYQSTSIDFLSYDSSTYQWIYRTSGIPQVIGGTLTGCELTYISGLEPSTQPQIDPATCEVSGFRDYYFGSCGGLHSTASGAFYSVVPYINGHPGKPVVLLLYNTADDSGPC